MARKTRTEKAGTPGSRRIHVGTSGWTYDDWQGVFYPEDVEGPERLSFYAGHFDAVEVNASFYRVPAPSAIKAWNKRLPARFHLVLKGSRNVTHRRRLADCEEPLGFFMERALQLTRLKVVLWQLPPFLHKDLPRLEEFLTRLPRPPHHGVEFRHESWWDDDTARLLHRHRAAFVAVSHPSLPKDVLPGRWLYVRFHGSRSLYDHRYTKRELTAWADRLRPHLDGRTLYAFFNNDAHAHAPANATTFRELLGEPPG